MRNHRLRGLWLLGVLLACTDPTGSDPPRDIDELAQRLDTLRRAHGIPGMAGAIGCDGAVRWSSGFGSADVARNVPATPQTVFHIASLTKTFASIILLQLVDEGRISLDDPVADYGVDLPGDVRVRHLMSHTSDPPPGAAFRYDGNRFALLDSVVRRADGQPFADAVLERVIGPAGLSRTAPSSLSGDGIDAAVPRPAGGCSVPGIAPAPGVGGPASWRAGRPRAGATVDARRASISERSDGVLTAATPRSDRARSCWRTCASCPFGMAHSTR